MALMMLMVLMVSVHQKNQMIRKSRKTVSLLMVVVGLVQKSISR